MRTTKFRTDNELIVATRAGDPDAYGQLWKRHYCAAKHAAISATSTFDPDDLAQEAFAAVYLSILKNGGPTTAFRAYLLATVRNTACSWGRAKREHASGYLIEELADPMTLEYGSDRELERSLTRDAFRALPERWQQVLWYTEVEGLRLTTVAEKLGIRPGAASQLALRAREGLREAWVQAHLRSQENNIECAQIVKRMGAYARGNASRRDARRVEEHLICCTSCKSTIEEANNANHRLTDIASMLSWADPGPRASQREVARPSRAGGGGTAASGAPMKQGKREQTLAH